MSPFRKVATVLMLAAGIAVIVALAADDGDVLRAAQAALGVSMLVFATAIYADFRAERRAERNTLEGLKK